jgi:SagB-type dehydrogenase family enzyme
MKPKYQKQIRKSLFALLLTLSVSAGTAAYSSNISTTKISMQNPIKEKSRITVSLPKPEYDSNTSIEESLAKRRSIRNFVRKPLSISEVSQLLWAAQGITAVRGGRTAPSAGALYPLEVYIIVGDVQDLPPGTYLYYPKKHNIIMITEGDIRSQLSSAAFEQTAVKDAAINLVFTAVFRRITGKYGDRGVIYTYMEAGHSAQNVCLQATAMGLGTVPVGAFNDKKISQLMDLPKDEFPLYIIPVGKLKYSYTSGKAGGLKL